MEGAKICLVPTLNNDFWNLALIEFGLESILDFCSCSQATYGGRDWVQV